jgi:hypothetical protein
MLNEPLSPPGISGLAIVDEILAATTGIYNSSPTATYTFQWQSCANVELLSGSTVQAREGPHSQEIYWNLR